MKLADKVRRNLTALLASIFVLTGCQPSTPVKSPQPIEIADEQGIGGSGRHLNDTGIGGSGKVAENGIGGSGRHGDDQGIGGSGMLAQEKGIGGSGRQHSEQTQHWLTQLQSGEKIGVVGTINDFGSIWVNGLHIHFDSSTPVTVDGKPVDPTTITLGQRAVITATMDADGKLRAEKIELIHEVIGPVSAVDTDHQSFTVLGQTVRLSSELAAIHPIPTTGDWVAVSGIRDQRQHITASQITPASETTTVLIRGVLTNTDNRLSIGEQTLSGVTIAADQQGRFAIIRGQLVGNQLEQLTIERPHAFSETASIKLISIERTHNTASHAGPYSPAATAIPQNVTSGQGLKIIEGHLAPDQKIQVDQVVPKPSINWQAQPYQSGQANQMLQPQHSPPPGQNNTGSPSRWSDMHTAPVVHQHMERPQSPRQHADIPQRPERFVRPPRPENAARNIRPQRRPNTLQTPRPPTRPTRPQPPKPPVR